MKKLLFIVLLSSPVFGFCQSEHISMIDYVEVLNNNKPEALFYYQNNWKQFRIQALEKGYIEAYHLLETSPTEALPYSFILITTYKNEAQYEASEKHFEEIISNSSGLKLMNDKKPGEFRKVIFHNDKVIHWN